MLTTIRRWAIRALAGKTAVVLNVHMKGQSIIAYDGRNMLIADCIFSECKGTPIDVRDKGKPVNEVLPFPKLTDWV